MQRRVLRLEFGREAYGAQGGGGLLQHPERQSDDRARAMCLERRAEALAGDLHRSLRPAHTLHRRLQLQPLARQSGRERGQQPLVAIARTRLWRVAENVTGPFGPQRPGARARGVRRIEPFRHPPRGLPLLGGQRQAVEEVIEGHVLTGKQLGALHRLEDAHKESIPRPELALLQAQVEVRAVDAAAAGAREQRPGDRGVPVDEFRAELDGRREIRLPSGPHAPPDAVARLEQQNRTARRDQLGRSGQPRGAGADHDDIEGGGGHCGTVRRAGAPRKARAAQAAGRARQAAGRYPVPVSRNSTQVGAWSLAFCQPRTSRSTPELTSRAAAGGLSSR